MISCVKVESYIVWVVLDNLYFGPVCTFDMMWVYGGPTTIKTDATWSFYREVLGCDELDLLLAI